MAELLTMSKQRSMPLRPFAKNGLWQCLCPLPLAREAPLVISCVGTDLQPHHQPRQPAAARGLNHRSRAYSTSGDTFTSFSNSLSLHHGSLSQNSQLPRNGPRSASRQSRDKPPLAQIPTPILYEHVRAEGAKGDFDEVMNICRVLIKDRSELPNKEMYTAVLHSFVSASNGTAGKLRRVLEEMGFWSDSQSMAAARPKIELDARACECILEVLAVHPDYLLRTEILEYMKSRWFTLSDRGLNFVIAGMLRERHFEHALETMEDMVRREARVEGWLFDKAMWMLLEFGEVEEAFHVLNLKEAMESAKRGGSGSLKISDALWGALLDAAAHKQLVRHAHVTMNMESFFTC